MSYWIRSARIPPFPRLSTDQRADVVVVGGGLTGLTTAYLLAAAGKTVIVLERMRLGGVDSSYTTAHVTMVTDSRLSDLITRFGEDHARAVWDAGLAAIDTIESIVNTLAINCSFSRVDGYLYAADAAASDDVEALRAEAETAARLGFDATFTDEVPLVARPGIRFAEQARFNPRQYMAGLVAGIQQRGGRIFENSPADEFSGDPLGVKVRQHTVSCNDIVLATHNPLVGIRTVLGATLFQTKLALYTSYAVAGKVTRGAVPDALYWDTADPYRYIRVDPRRTHDVVIVGGEDHKTGQVIDTTACFERLERFASELIPSVELTHRWSGQVIETHDGLPYIGRNAEHQYVATGYAGNGMTFGTLAGVIVADEILQRRNPWRELFDTGRTSIARGLVDYVKENLDYPYYFLRDTFSRADARPFRSLEPGTGAVIEHRGRAIAASRSDDGRLLARSATCTHMGCTVRWNVAEKTWDCPCHGSRFTPSGEVLAGPAEKPLARIEASDRDRD